MKKSILVGMIIAVVSLGFIAVLKAGEPSPQLKAPPQKWEYLILMAPAPQTDDQLNKLGKGGWELVSAIERQANGNSTNDVTWYLKRPLTQ